jgi:hypothetical protein
MILHYPPKVLNILISLNNNKKTKKLLARIIKICMTPATPWIFVFWSV